MADQLNFQLPPQGFNSYLNGIIPDDQAVLAGAFSVSMQQIRNLDKVNLSDFAKVAYNMESTVDLPLTNGTDVPTNIPLSTVAKFKTALGSGVYGTYTMSNFLGAMSGLPYPWESIYNNIIALQTQNLTTIYQNLYLLIKWEQATATWNGTSFTYTNRGGGYGRNGSVPTVTVGGNPATVSIGTDPNNLDTFGKIISITYSGPAGAVVISAPIGDNPFTNNAAYNAAVQEYIDDANNEIQAIAQLNAENFERSKVLNTLWNITGIALKHEQRARYIAITPVPVPYDNRTTNYPTSMYSFVDSIPDYAKQTLPHMAAQTLEHISDLETVGGQSLVAMMRQQRNQDRLSEIGIDLDNNIQDELDENSKRKLLVNGVLCGATEGIESPNGCIYTLPAWPQNTDPFSYYDCSINGLRLVEDTTQGSILPLLNGDTCPVVNPLVPIGDSPPIDADNGIFVTQDGNIPNFYIPDPFPPEIDTKYTGTTLIPSTYNVDDAINKVIECNCDCWIN